MSCSSWTNSISAAGAAFASLRPKIRDDLFGEPLALAARLEADEDVAGVLLAWRTVPAPIRCAANRRDFGRFGRTFFDRLAPADPSLRAPYPPASGNR